MVYGVGCDAVVAGFCGDVDVLARRRTDVASCRVLDIVLDCALVPPADRHVSQGVMVGLALILERARVHADEDDVVTRVSEERVTCARTALTGRECHRQAA